MDKLRTGVFVLLLLVVPVSCSVDIFFTDPVICYFLDGFLMIYCIVATALFFREKFSKTLVELPYDENGIYQELERPKDTDPYAMLEPQKRKKKAGKKPNKSTAAQPDERDKDPYESLSASLPPPPVSVN